ncbi:MAG: hypothetical protein H6Q38_2481, partial [Chloroflexi bacterium]|nr:hypothetical protein [Chloroflexota bacterium]
MDFVVSTISGVHDRCPSQLCVFHANVSRLE